MHSERARLILVLAARLLSLGRRLLLHRVHRAHRLLRVGALLLHQLAYSDLRGCQLRIAFGGKNGTGGLHASPGL